MKAYAARRRHYPALLSYYSVLCIYIRIIYCSSSSSVYNTSTRQKDIIIIIQRGSFRRREANLSRGDVLLCTAVVMGLEN
jgi:hypothetical protein